MSNKAGVLYHHQTLKLNNRYKQIMEQSKDLKVLTETLNGHFHSKPEMKLLILERQDYQE